MNHETGKLAFVAVRGRVETREEHSMYRLNKTKVEGYCTFKVLGGFQLLDRTCTVTRGNYDVICSDSATLLPKENNIFNIRLQQTG